ncbi:serine/arginine repetitive matrix protein 1 [Eucalyptus grandis]|uniref:serine/arginine repetitive matrix protein 1 n=1 Tax=Eucalyptus grandis TaxID=71139 RepID=UPI00192EDECA|nr:serine/arginine repetitive matrix protein 1 [Eucalyptus grandis]
MEDPTTGGDALFPPNFVTIRDLREQWLQRREQQQRPERLETWPRSPHGKPPQQRTPPPPPSFPPLPAQKDRRKQLEQERPRRQADVGRERVKGARGTSAILLIGGPFDAMRASRRVAVVGRSARTDRRKQPEQELPRGETDTERERAKAKPTNASDSRPSPANCSAVRRHTSGREGSDGGRAIDSNGPKPSEKSSRGECAGFGADEKADSALAKDRRKQPEQELPRGETDTERERGKARPRNASDSRPSPANCSAVRRHTSGKEGSDVRRAIDSNGPKPSGKLSPGECAGFGADEKAESASVKDQRKQPEQELPQGETNTERERGKARPRNESDSRPSTAQCWAVPSNTSVKEGTGVREAIDSDGPKSWQKSSRGRYAGIGTDEKAEWAPVAVVSADAESAEQVKKTKESKKKRKNNQKGKGKLNKDIVRAKEMGAKPEEGEMNTPAEEVKKEKFQRASSEGQNVMLESKELRVEAKPEEVVAHMTAKEAKKLFQPAGSESKDDMPESNEVVGVEVKNVAANASHVRAKAEGLNKKVWVINSKVEIEEKLRNSKRSGFQLGRPNHGEGKGYRGFVSKEQQRRVIKQSSDMVWVRKEDISDGHAGESSS